MKTIILTLFLLLSGCNSACGNACVEEGWDWGKEELGLCHCAKGQSLVDIIRTKPEVVPEQPAMCPIPETE